MVDLAAQVRGIALVPLLTHFNDAQLRHVVATAGAAHVLSDQPQRLEGRSPPNLWG
jgi:hypothetical protein